jgi:hypothetical protein
LQPTTAAAIMSRRTLPAVRLRSRQHPRELRRDLAEAVAKAGSRRRGRG